MIFFSAPCNQDRLNATLHELLHLKFQGAVRVEGCWDVLSAVEYLKGRCCILEPHSLTTGVEPLYVCNDKLVLFAPAFIMVTTDADDVLPDEFNVPV